MLSYSYTLFRRKPLDDIDACMKELNELAKEGWRVVEIEKPLGFENVLLLERAQSDWLQNHRTEKE